MWRDVEDIKQDKVEILGLKKWNISKILFFQILGHWIMAVVQICFQSPWPTLPWRLITHTLGYLTWSHSSQTLCLLSFSVIFILFFILDSVQWYVNSPFPPVICQLLFSSSVFFISDVIVFIFWWFSWSFQKLFFIYPSTFQSVPEHCSVLSSRLQRHPL